MTTGDYLTLEELAAYSRISVRQLQRYLARSVDPLPARRNGRRHIVRRVEFDAWWAAQSRPAARARKPLAKARSLREIAAEVKADAMERRGA